MKLPILTVILLMLVGSIEPLTAQVRRSTTNSRSSNTTRAPEIGQSAFVIDETLSVLRAKPSLFSESIQRMRRGRKVQIMGVAEADGVKFYRVTAPPSNAGWVQADAVYGRFRPSDEQRLATLVHASNGFEQIEIAVEFLKIYPESKLRPAILLLFGDLLEEVAGRLSRDAGARLNRKEMAASGAPLHSYYLNFVSLDRYRRLGVYYRFNASTRQFHYDGASWKEILAKFPESPEAADAGKRLETLQAKMAAVMTSQ